jgi:GTP-binding protein
MKIASSQFVMGVTDLGNLPRPEHNEIAFLGRSNVGKSSLINALCKTKRLARPSQTPGKTRELNYYLINRQFYFVDLPGYGYARLPTQLRSKIGSLIERYLQERQSLVLAILLVDSRHEPTALDVMMAGWLDYYEIPFTLVLTKADKIPQSKKNAVLTEVRRVVSGKPSCKGVLLFSSVTGEGRTELLRTLSQYVSSPS